MASRSRRKYAVGSFTPCSPRHHHCSPAHAALVAGYRDERRRQALCHEVELSYPGERKLWKENGIRLVNFRDWLIANRVRRVPSAQRDVDAEGISVTQLSQHQHVISIPAVAHRFITETECSSTMNVTLSIGPRAEHARTTKPISDEDSNHANSASKQKGISCEDCLDCWIGGACYISDCPNR